MQRLKVQPFLSFTVWSSLLPPPVKPTSSPTLCPEGLPQGAEEPAAVSFSWPIIGCYNWQLVFSLPTFLSRSGSLKVSRNFLTCSERRRSMLRASMARPRNSSTSSSGFRFSCVFLKMKCLNNTRLHKVMLTCRGDTEGSQESAETFFFFWLIICKLKSSSWPQTPQPTPPKNPVYQGRIAQYPHINQCSSQRDDN